MPRCPFCDGVLVDGVCIFLAEQWHEDADDDWLLLDLSDIT